MGVLGQRQFLNLIVAGRYPGVKSLRRINVAHLFNHRDTDTPPPPPPSKTTTTEMETLRLPRPSFTFRALNNGWNLNCFPLGDSNKVICRDQSGYSFIFDLDSRKAGTMPPLPKLPTAAAAKSPVSVFVPKPHVDDDNFHRGSGSSLFLMERFPQLDPVCYEPQSEQFVAFIYHYPGGALGGKSFTCCFFPPPPFVEETWRWSSSYNNNNNPEITAYGVVGGGSHVCISVQDVGTYCLTTARHEWSHVGTWMLPFHGKVEYVPELKLWFGLSADADADTGAGRQHCFLAAADLSDMMDSSQQPQLVAGPWKELVDPPDEWKECKDPQFVSLGSGRFCIARFFREEATEGSAAGDQVTVFTGVEVNSCSGKGDTGKQVQMTPHRSIRVYNTSIIEALF